MEQQDLLMTFVPLTILMNSSIFLKILGLQLKVEHQEAHVTFLDCDIISKDNIYIYMLFGREDSYTFFIVRLPHLYGNIPNSIMCTLFSLELLRIASYN